MTPRSRGRPADRGGRGRGRGRRRGRSSGSCDRGARRSSRWPSRRPTTSTPPRSSAPRTSATASACSAWLGWRSPAPSSVVAGARPPAVGAGACSSASAGGPCSAPRRPGRALAMVSRSSACRSGDRRTSARWTSGSRPRPRPPGSATWPRRPRSPRSSPRLGAAILLALVRRLPRAWWAVPRAGSCAYAVVSQGSRRSCWRRSSTTSSAARRPRADRGARARRARRRRHRRGLRGRRQPPLDRAQRLRRRARVDQAGRRSTTT